jgi:HlyD family secretion protein
MSGQNPPARRKWSAKMPMWFGMLSVAILFGVLGVWGNFATISGAIISSGMIQGESLRQVVQHPQGGVVGAIDVKEGDRVEAGQVLIRFDDKLLRSQLTTVDSQLKEIFARRARLIAERDDADSLVFTPELVELGKTDQSTVQLMQGQTRLFEARRKSLQQQTKQLNERKVQI